MSAPLHRQTRACPVAPRALRPSATCLRPSVPCLLTPRRLATPVCADLSSCFSQSRGLQTGLQAGGHRCLGPRHGRQTRVDSAALAPSPAPPAAPTLATPPVALPDDLSERLRRAMNDWPHALFTTCTRRPVSPRLSSVPEQPSHHLPPSRRLLDRGRVERRHRHRRRRRGQARRAREDPASLARHTTCSRHRSVSCHLCPSLLRARLLLHRAVTRQRTLSSKCRAGVPACVSTRETRDRPTRRVNVKLL